MSGMTVEQRQKFIAAAARGLAWRRQRINEWRWLLHTTHWWLQGKEPDWHDYVHCERHHPWPPVEWSGPYELGCDPEPLPDPVWDRAACASILDALRRLEQP